LNYYGVAPDSYRLRIGRVKETAIGGTAIGGTALACQWFGCSYTLFSPTTLFPPTHQELRTLVPPYLNNPRNETERFDSDPAFFLLGGFSTAQAARR
jgi:hypothetical protein